MSIVEKMVECYNASWDAAKDVTAKNVPKIRSAAMLAALTATGLTEAQLEGLAAGTHVVRAKADRSNGRRLRIPARQQRDFG